MQAILSPVTTGVPAQLSITQEEQLPVYHGQLQVGLDQFIDTEPACAGIDQGRRFDPPDGAFRNPLTGCCRLICGIDQLNLQVKRFHNKRFKVKRMRDAFLQHS